MDLTDSSKEQAIPASKLFSDPAPIQTSDPAASFFDLLGTGYSQNIPFASGQSFVDNILASDEIATHLPTCTEAERRRDAWIPSERTHQSLVTMATSTPGSYFPERDLLTMPGVMLSEELGDAIGEAASACFGDTVQRRRYKASDVTQDERGLRELIKAGAYSAGINLTTNLLAIYGQGHGRMNHPSKHSPNSLQLWFTRIALFMKMKMYNLAQNEAEPFSDLDKPDLFYQFYPDMYKGRPGSIASFAFRLLLAELPLHYQKPKESLIRLFKILAVIRQILKNLGNSLAEDGSPTELHDDDRSDSVKLWTGRETRTLHSIINCLVVIRDFELAFEIMESLTEKANSIDKAHSAMMLSAFGRLRLQVGDVPGAEVCFQQSKIAQSLFRAGEEKKTGVVIRELVDRGLLAVAQNSFNDAYGYFKEANALDSNNVMVINNMGVCLLYSGKLKDAIVLFESAIMNNPSEGLHESLLLNLSTLYDMESANNKTKKLGLLKQIAQYWMDAPTAVIEKFYN